jgi:hypothetical protein
VLIYEVTDRARFFALSIVPHWLLQGLKIFLRKTASKDVFRPSGRAKTALEKHLFQPRKNILASWRENRANP